jgi:hypothetical protein
MKAHYLGGNAKADAKRQGRQVGRPA